MPAVARYLEDFGRLKATPASDQDLFDKMTALNPDWVANQLMFGFPGAQSRRQRFILS
jgi:hypothetical protein